MRTVRSLRWWIIGLVCVGTILNYLAPLWDDRNQAWHDKIVNTLVVEA